MPAQLELEEDVEAVREQQQRHALERRERNSLAIAEVVGRNPARKPAQEKPSVSTDAGRLRTQRN
ncbi:MAG TPA: hypothetical protein VET69_02100 [Terriglobales bacterium]|nr:hypothetical protein [Terriglobales bacterium]